MVNHWMLVVDPETYKPGGRVVGLSERWKESLLKVEPGDLIVTYMAKRSEFVDISKVVEGYHFDDSGKENGQPHKIRITEVFVPEEPIDAAELVSSLRFVTNKEKWYVHFNKAMQEIPSEDFEFIWNKMEHRKGIMGYRSNAKRREQIERQLKKRVPTGVPGLDEIIEGGLPSNSSILVTGGPGSGKTILCMQFLIHGIKNGEPGIIISMDERPEDLRREALKFGWDLTKYEDEGMLAIVDVSYPRSGLPSKEKYKMSMPFTLDSIVTTTFDIINDIGAKRVVLDSLPAFGLHFEDESEVRIAIHRLNNLLLGSDCTSIITSEIIPGHEGISRFGVEEFISRGIILMELLKEGNEFTRRMTILKMRETNYKLRMYKFKITNKGIKVLPTEVRI